MAARVTQKLRQFNGIRQRTAGMAGNEIRHQILLLADFFILLHKGFDKFQIHFFPGLAHMLQRCIRNMLGSDL